MPCRLACGAAIALLLAGCGGLSTKPVVDQLILPCPSEPITEPECREPPPEGTERPQKDVFANERACYRQTRAWIAAWDPCGRKRDN